MDFRKGEIIAIDKPYRMSSFGALAHERLSIVDPESGRQPLFAPDKKQ